MISMVFSAPVPARCSTWWNGQAANKSPGGIRKRPLTLSAEHCRHAHNHDRNQRRTQAHLATTLPGSRSTPNEAHGRVYRAGCESCTSRTAVMEDNLRRHSNVFITWSGERSRVVAEALRD